MRSIVSKNVWIPLLVLSLAFCAGAWAQEYTPMEVDIKPGSLNIQSKGVLPVVITGDGTVEMTDIDRASVRLVAVHLDGTEYPLSQEVAPVRSSIEDVASAEDGSAEADGMDDLTLKFRTQHIYKALLNDAKEVVVNGSEVTLVFTAAMGDALLQGEDAVLLKVKKSKDKKDKGKKEKGKKGKGKKTGDL